MIAEVAALVAAEPLAARPIPAPQFGNSPDSGRPPVEHFPRPIPAPGGRPDTSPRPELVVSLVLQRAHGGAVAKLDKDYLDRGLPTTGHLAGACNELTAAGLLTVADPDPHGLRRITLTTAGHTRYDQFRGTLRPPGLPVPDPQFPAIKIPARERLSGPGPRQPDPHRPAESGVGPLRWARCPTRGACTCLCPPRSLSP